MADPAGVAELDAALASADAEHVHGAIVAIGAEERVELIDRVVPYLDASAARLREAAVRTLVAQLHLGAYQGDALHMLGSDPDPGVRAAAALALASLARTDQRLVQHLVQVALNDREDERVRAAAFEAALAGAGLERAERPPEGWSSGFDASADWAVLAGALTRAGIAVPAELAARAARR